MSQQHTTDSGGGDNGAFGAGVLNGWTETGTRPQFKGVLVTLVWSGVISLVSKSGTDNDDTNS